jgi:methionyl-tRNA synthetase
LQAKLNSELLNNLGNFINRVLSFVAKPAGKSVWYRSSVLSWASSIVPSFCVTSFCYCFVGAGYGSFVPDAPHAGSHPLTKTLVEKTSKWVDQYLEAMEKVTVHVKQNQSQVPTLHF